MTERHGEPTRYLTFKLDKYTTYLTPSPRCVLRELLNEPEGLTFDELRERTGAGPQHLRVVLGDLFNKNYIITNHQIAKLSKKLGIDINKLRRYEL